MLRTTRERRRVALLAGTRWEEAGEAKQGRRWIS